MQLRSGKITTPIVVVQKKQQNGKNNSSKPKSQNSGRRVGNARNEGIIGQNLGGLGEMRSAPVSMSKNIKTGVPKMDTLRNGDCLITHREYIQDIVAPSTGASFNATQLAINPGQSTTFQWLSKIAANFESYKFKRLVFDYETEAPSSLGGTLVMAVDYDASDPVPTTKQVALATRGAVRSAPWSPCCHRSIKEDLEKQKSYFVRPGLQPANTDIRLWDVGNLNVITQGISSNSATCGELYVEYTVLLMTPIYEIPNVPTSSTVTMAAATTAAPLSNGIVLGNLISAITNAGAVTLENLVVGNEYVVAYGGGNIGDLLTISGLAGLTQKTVLYMSGYVYGYTYTATALVGGFQLNLTLANPGAAMLIVAQVPVSAL